MTIMTDGFIRGIRINTYIYLNTRRNQRLGMTKLLNTFYKSENRNFAKNIVFGHNIYR